MSQIFRFFEPVELTERSSISLTGDSHHILSRVLRMQEGNHVEILNGKGQIAKAMLKSITKKNSVVYVYEVVNVPEQSVAIQLYVGCLKGEKLSLIVQKACELGVSHIGFFLSDHSVAAKSESILGKSQKTAIEALRQSGNPYLPTMDFFANIRNVPLLKDQNNWNLVFNEREPKPFQDLLQLPKPSKISLLIGPEGGFSDDEKLFFQSQGCYSIRIAPFVLRSETAAISAVASCVALFGRNSSDEK